MTHRLTIIHIMVKKIEIHQTHDADTTLGKLHSVRPPCHAQLFGNVGLVFDVYFILVVVMISEIIIDDMYYLSVLVRILIPCLTFA